MELTANKVQANSEGKQKKKTKGNKQPTSQGDNRTFNFKWDPTKPDTKGKVFAKKRKAPTEKTAGSTLTTPGDTHRKFDDHNSTKLQKIHNFKAKQNKINGSTATETVSADSTFTDNDHNSSKGNIKRKHKKDKLLAKQLAKEGHAVDVKRTQNERKDYSLFGQTHKGLHVDTSAGKSMSETVFSGGSFRDLSIHKYLVSNLEKFNFAKLTNVQGKSIPVIMTGKNTLIRSQTGSGKTLAYAVPIIDALQGINPRLKRSDGVQAIIVVPTRELALQTHELFSKINTFQWVVVSHLCGGENRKSEKDRIRKGINVLIGTPGRLLDHVLHTSALNVDNVRCLVLDEADRLLDMGFRKDIISLVEILDKSKSSSDYNPMTILKKSQNDFVEEAAEEVNEDLGPLNNVNSKERQTILLSATLNEGVSELAEFTMKEHTYIDALDESNTSSDGFVIPSTVKQEFLVTYVKHRLFTLSALLVAKSKSASSKIFVFMASTQMVDFHYELFSKFLAKMPVNRGKSKIGNVALLHNDSDDSDEDEEEVVMDTQFFRLHGSMDQKVRKEVFNAFRAATKGILICTDVAARGIDVPTADCIIQYTGPQTDEDYLHRVGRTGRAGKSGSAIIFLTHEEQDYINHLRDHKVFMKEQKANDFLRHLCDLVEEPDQETAATALQNRFESAIAKDKELHKAACFAYSTWSRFYSSYPAKMRTYFNFKSINLGHYVTSFGLRDTPTIVSKVVRGEVIDTETPRLNSKLANHKIEGATRQGPKPGTKQRTKPKKKSRSASLMTSEFSSGLEPSKKKKKKKVED